jgi:transposase
MTRTLRKDKHRSGPALEDRPKRGLAVDALGLIIAVVVIAASVTDNAIGVRLLDSVLAHTPTVTKVWADAGFKDDVAIHGAVNGIDVEQVKRSDATAGFVPVKRRWVLEQTNGTLMLHRRLVREYELPRRRGNSYYPEVLVIPS